MELEDRFTKRMAYLRVCRGLTQTALGDQTGLGFKIINGMERHRHRHVLLGEAVVIAAALGVTVEQMVSTTPLTITETAPPAPTPGRRAPYGRRAAATPS